MVGRFACVVVCLLRVASCVSDALETGERRAPALSEDEVDARGVHPRPQTPSGLCAPPTPFGEEARLHEASQNSALLVWDAIHGVGG